MPVFVFVSLSISALMFVLYMTHTLDVICSLQNLKEQYLSYRRVVLQDPTDIFEERKKAVKKGTHFSKV